MDPLSLDPERPEQPDLPLADLEFLHDMEGRAGSLAQELAVSSRAIDRIESQLQDIGIQRETTNQVLFRETFETALEAGKSLGFDVRCERREVSLSSIVGDPNKRQDLAPYRALVDFKAGRFRAARARARRCVRRSGEWPLGASFLRLAVTGEIAITALRFAGFLRSCRIVELVDVVHHASVLDGLSDRFDTVTC